MPYAKITLTCSTCGNEFEHRHKCYKSRDIDSYIDWAKSNITTCPECYAKLAREADKNHMLEKYVTIRVSYRDFKTTLANDRIRSVPDTYDAQTKSILVAIDAENAFFLKLYGKNEAELTAYLEKYRNMFVESITPQDIKNICIENLEWSGITPSHFDPYIIQLPDDDGITLQMGSEMKHFFQKEL